MKISFSNEKTANLHHDFGLREHEVSHLLSETTFLLLFSLNMREKFIGETMFGGKFRMIITHATVIWRKQNTPVISLHR